MDREPGNVPQRRNANDNESNDSTNSGNRKATRRSSTSGERAKTQSASMSRRAQRRIDEERSRKRQRMMLVGGAVALAVVVVIALIAISRPDDDSSPELAVTSLPERDASIPQDGRTLGNPDAPLTIIEYADFQCPACGEFARTVEPQLIEEYVKTGKVKLVYHDFPFLDDRSDEKESDNASEAAFCAQEQGQFWAYHDMVYSNQDGENNGAFSRDRLIEMARNVPGIDVDQFTSCIDGDEYEDDVQELYQATIDAGVQSTPTFVMGDRQVSGTNYPALKQEIDAALGS